jgi:predicted Holliday junction resolvase-like endonuclease
VRLQTQYCNSEITIKMLKLVLAFVFIALILLIMRISNLNTKIATMDEQLSDFVTQEYLTEFMELKSTNTKELELQVEEMKQRMANTPHE